MEILVIFFFSTIVILIIQLLAPPLSQHKPDTSMQHDTSANRITRIYCGSEDTDHVHHYLFTP